MLVQRAVCTTIRRAAGRRPGTSVIATTSSWLQACTSITSKRRTARRRSAGSPSSTSRSEGHLMDEHDTRWSLRRSRSLAAGRCRSPQPSQTTQTTPASGRSSAEFSAVRRRGPGHCAGRRVRRARHRRHGAVLQPRRPGAHAQAPRDGRRATGTSRTRATPGRASGFPMSGGARAVGVSIGIVRVQRAAGDHRRVPGWDGTVYSVNAVVRLGHVLRRTSRTGSPRGSPSSTSPTSSGRTSGTAVRGGLRHQLPRHGGTAPHPRRVRDSEPRHHAEAFRRGA